MFYQIFFSPQVKRSAITINKHGIYQMTDELPNNLRLRKYQENFIEVRPSTRPYSQNENFVNATKKTAGK